MLPRSVSSATTSLTATSLLVTPHSNDAVPAGRESRPRVPTWCVVADVSSSSTRYDASIAKLGSGATFTVRYCSAATLLRATSSPPSTVQIAASLGAHSGFSAVPWKPSKNRIVSPGVSGSGSHGLSTASPSGSGVAGGGAIGHLSQSSPIPSPSSSYMPPGAFGQWSTAFERPSPSLSPAASMQVGPPCAVKSQTPPAAHGTFWLHGPPSGSPPLAAVHAPTRIDTSRKRTRSVSQDSRAKCGAGHRGTWRRPFTCAGASTPKRAPPVRHGGCSLLAP